MYFLCILLFLVKNYCHIYSYSNMKIADNIRDGEILILRGTTILGRSWEQHARCGAIMRPYDCVWLKSSLVPIDGANLAGIKDVLIFDGMELCTVGFLGNNIAALKKSSDKFLNKFSQVIELYDSSEDAYKSTRKWRRYAQRKEISPPWCWTKSTQRPTLPLD